jgi:hypothetical protein
MARIRSRNNALTFFVNGRRAQQLEGLSDPLGNLLSRYDVAVTRAVVGLKRRAQPAVSRAIRAHYNIRPGKLSGKFRVEETSKGRGADRDDAIAIWASTRKFPLIDFAGRWGGRKTPGATATINHDAKVYDGAFIATVKGLKAIRVRRFDASTGRRAGRGPLVMLRGPSPFEMVSGLDYEPARAVNKAVLDELRQFYTAELRRQFQLSRGTNGR